MNPTKPEATKTALEIGSLAKLLTPQNQSFVLNTINTLLFSQQSNIDNVSKFPNNGST